MHMLKKRCSAYRLSVGLVKYVKRESIMLNARVKVLICTCISMCESVNRDVFVLPCPEMSEVRLSNNSDLSAIRGSA